MRRAVLALLASTLVLPGAAGAAGSVEVRRVDIDKLPLVRVTTVVPAGKRPTIAEGGRPAGFVKARELSSAQAMVLAVDNSVSMTGRPLREVKRAAKAFLGGEHRAEAGLVAFGHEALVLTQPRETKADVGRTIGSLAPDAQIGTALYDAVVLSVARLQEMSTGSRVLVVLTDAHDVGSGTDLEISQNSLADAIAAAQRANVVVFVIAAGAKTDLKPLRNLASATGGRLFGVTDVTGLGAAYRSFGRELNRTWQLSYLSDARPGDEISLTVRAGRRASARSVKIPSGDTNSGLVPLALARSPLTAGAVILLAALLIAGAGAVGRGRRRSSELARLLEAHITPREVADESPRRLARFEALVAWTERSLSELPGSERLARAVERSGLKLRIGYVPYLAGLSAFAFGIVATIVGAPPALTLLAMLVGLFSPLVVLKALARRRSKAFDRQLPDVLATIASTLRAGHGFRVALRAIADDSAAPASEEFAQVLGEERLGRPLDQAIAAMCERIESPDLDYVATAVNVQSQTGGSLATLFDTLSETVRERQRHARKVKALTSLGRMSATVLVAMPPVLAMLMTLLNPAYMAPLYSTSNGHLVIGLCMASMTIGAFVLKRIVSVKF